MTTKADALATRPIDDLRALLEKAKPALQAILPRHVTAERLIKTALVAVNRQPLLLQCTRESILLALMQAAELGLEVGSLIGGAHLVPYRNKNGEFQAQCIPDYRGLIELVRRSEKVTAFDARVVHARDQFQIALGTRPGILHVPCLDADPGEIVVFYAVAAFVEGEPQFDWMTKVEVDRIRARSRAANDGPWVTDYEAMGKKTIVKRLCKLLPHSRELATALEAEDAAEAGEALFPDGALHVLATIPAEDRVRPKTKADEVKAALAAKVAEPASAPPLDAAGHPIPAFTGTPPGRDDLITPGEIDAALAAGKGSVEREGPNGTVISANLMHAGLADRPTLEAARAKAAEAMLAKIHTLMDQVQWEPEKQERALAEYRGREGKLLKHLQSQAGRILGRGGASR